jgi:Tol biopolymer transport system component
MRPVAEAAIEGHAIQLGVLVGLSRPPVLREAVAARSPLVVGLLRPAVVVPAGAAAQLSPGELRMALAHELAHVRRGDLWLALVPGLAQILFFFHPLVWLACREWTTAREAACDAAALQATDAPPDSYGRLLLKLVAANKGVDVAPALGTTAGFYTLHGRLKMLQQFTPRPRRWVRAGMIGVIALGGISVLPWRLTARASLAQGAQSRPAREMTARRVWASGGVDIQGAPSPDGRYLSFTDWDTGDLAIRDLATGKNRRLTNKGSWSESPEWAAPSAFSPDGKQVAYVWWNKEGFYDLRLIGRDGSRPRVLYRKEELGWMQPDWSSDGKQILALLFGKDKTSQMALISVADGSARVLKTLPQSGYGEMRLSPDGRTVAYDYRAQADAPERDIFLIATDGSGEIPLVQHPANDFVLGWSPDGKSLLFASDRTGTTSAWLVPVSAGKPQGAPELVKQEMGALSPLGFDRKGSLYYGVRAGIEEVYTATLDPATGKLLAPPQPVDPRLVGSKVSPAWSPDGRYLAYLSPEKQESPRIGTRLVTIRSVTSGETRELSLRFDSIGQMNWSPDGRSFLVLGNDGEGRKGAFRIDAQTGASTPIPDAKQFRRWVAWGLDGKSIIYRAGRAIRERDLETGRETELYRGPEATGQSYLTLSPDGRQLALSGQDYGTGAWALKVMPAAGGEPRELLRGVTKSLADPVVSIAWMPDGHHLLFVREKEVWQVPVAGGEPQRLGLAMEGLRELKIHPDGRRIAFTAGWRKFEVWVMENLFPTAQTARASAARQ